MLIKTIKIALLALAGCSMSCLAYADGTPAGTIVQNTFKMDYTVGGFAQATVDTSAVGSNTPTEFTVDRLIDLTVASNGDLNVAAGAADQELVFSLFNGGNDVQAYSLSVVNEIGDEYNATLPTLYYYIDDGDASFEPEGDDGSPIAYDDSKTPDVAADARLWVMVRSQIPAGLAEGDIATVSVVADTLEPSAQGAGVTPVVADSDGNSIEGAAENVLADGSGTDNEVANEGDHSASADYIAFLPLVVRNTNDSGKGSLRDAITYANANVDEDNIIFEIPGTGPHTITLLSTLPDITDTGVSIDGSTQSGASCGDLVADTPHSLEINITGGNVADIEALQLSGSNGTIAGIAFHDFIGRVIHFSGSGNTLTCNYIGFQTDGETIGAVGHTVDQAAVLIDVGVIGAIVSNNLIANARYRAASVLGSDALFSRNIIRDSHRGIYLSEAGSQAAITENLIYNHTFLPIDLDPALVTNNDTNDVDTGPNDLLNYPVLNSVVMDGTDTFSYDFDLDVPYSEFGYRIEFFANSAAHPSGYGEGEIYLGSVDIAHAGGGSLNFTGFITTGDNVDAGTIMAATATRKTETSLDITSEFSLVYTSVVPTELSAAKTVDVYDPTSAGLYALPGNDVISSITITNGGESAADADTILLIDAVTSEVSFYIGDMDDGGPATDAVYFIQTGGAGLTFTYATDVAYSDAITRPADFASCNYVPSAGYDDAITYVCINPKGAMTFGDPDPTMTVQYRTRIK